MGRCVALGKSILKKSFEPLFFLNLKNAEMARHLRFFTFFKGCFIGSVFLRCFHSGSRPAHAASM